MVITSVQSFPHRVQVVRGRDLDGGVGDGHLHDVAADLEDFVEGSPVAEVALHELVGDAAAARVQDVEPALDGALARVAANYACGCGALVVGSGCRVEDEARD